MPTWLKLNRFVTKNTTVLRDSQSRLKRRFAVKTQFREFWRTFESDQNNLFWIRDNLKIKGVWNKLKACSFLWVYILFWKRKSVFWETLTIQWIFINHFTYELALWERAKNKYISEAIQIISSLKVEQILTLMEENYSNSFFVDFCVSYGPIWYGVDIELTLTAKISKQLSNILGNTLDRFGCNTQYIYQLVNV